MNLESIINITGKKGLYKVISRNQHSLIVENIENKKREPIYSHMQANMLEEIGIYTYEETKPLSEIFDEIYKKENGKTTISHKSSKEELTSFFRHIVPEYDEERVYLSDIKKVIQWYNLMQENKMIMQNKKKNKENENSN